MLGGGVREKRSEDLLMRLPKGGGENWVGGGGGCEPIFQNPPPPWAPESASLLCLGRV